MRIVLDTNVVLSALLWRGTPYDLFQSIRRRDSVQLFTSVVLLEELAEILTRPTPAKRLALIGVAGHDVLTAYVESVDLVAPVATPAVVAADPDDDHVIAAAVAARADLIVSGDRHLLDLGRHGAIGIVTAAEAVRLIAVL